MDTERLNRQLDFLVEIDKMKEVYRNTILMDASRRENDAEHTWHMAVCAMLFTEYANDQNLDMSKVFRMILIHDLVEIDAGDTFAYDEKGNAGKAEREQAAARRIFGLLPGDQQEDLTALWNEFEEYETEEAKYAHLVDTFMPIYHNYRTGGLQWRKLGVTSDRVLSRLSYIRKGSEELWEFMKGLVKDAVEKGFLQE